MTIVPFFLLRTLVLHAYLVSHCSSPLEREATFHLPRLDRLLSLLSNGDSLAVKRSAATQIGQVVSSNPKEVESLLDKVYLSETRLRAEPKTRLNF